MRRWLPPRKGARHVMRVVSEIMQFKPAPRPNHEPVGTNLSQALEVLGHLSRRRAVSFVVSDFLGNDYDHALRVAAARHDLVPVYVSDPREDKLPDVGLMLAEDLETGEWIEVDTRDPRVREHYRRTVARRRSPATRSGGSGWTPSTSPRTARTSPPSRSSSAAAPEGCTPDELPA